MTIIRKQFQKKEENTERVEKRIALTINKIHANGYIEYVVTSLILSLSISLLLVG